MPPQRQAGIDLLAALEEVERRVADAANKHLPRNERHAAAMYRELTVIQEAARQLQAYEWADADEVVVLACTQLAAQARGLLKKLTRAVAQVEPRETKDSGPGMPEFIDHALGEER
jgi:uncharacterized protein with HEPN domain